MNNIIKFLPSLFFFWLWFSIVSDGNNIKQAIEQPLSSNEYIETIGQAIDNPWTHNGAIRLHFMKLLKDQASPHTWQGSSTYAWALWSQYQYDGSIEIMLGIAHQSNNLLEEKYWATLFSQSHPNSALADEYLEHIESGHTQHLPLALEGAW